ncbi:universal stress protein [Paenarthrobacter ureafaciens]|jgi:nucleotide-binding universal stress UspA family protein|uniref:universal stress protein n=1 Tax=Paenarthrobacter ureafaciens TaxID=37931 RepID=UPI001C2C42EC|nr:universal stress protein [Paenarthrobacter ureafaciens]
MSEAIVVGVGDSPSSEAAMRWAMHRAAALKLPVLLVHAVDDRWAYDAVGYNDWIRNSGAALLSDAKDRAAKMEPTVSLSTDLVHGAPGYSLRKKSKKASMVVIGSGHSWVGGSLTDRALQVAAVAQCPVAVIGEHDLSTRKGVLVGADGSEESIQAVGFAAAEADRTGQELTVMHAFRLPDPWLSRGMPGGDFNGIIEAEERVVLAETVAGLADTYPDLTVHQVLQTDRSPAEALLGAAKTASLLVVGSRGRGSFKRLMLGSTAHAVLAKLPCPTIITRVKPVKHKG